MTAERSTVPRSAGAWLEVVRRRMPELGLRPERQAEVEEELADLLADFAAEADVDPTDGPAADRWLAREVPDWPALARRVASVERRPAPPTPPVPAPPPGLFSLEVTTMNVLRELRFACRVLAKRPGFTATAVLTLALGIGFNAAVFTLVDALLFRPLPVERPSELVQLYSVEPNAGLRYMPLSYFDLTDLEADVRSFSGTTAFAQTLVALDVDGTPRQTLAELAAGDFFQVLGVGAAVGRVYGPDEDRKGAGDSVAVLAHHVWVRDFGSDPAVVGRTLRLNGQPFTVVGVAPEGFRGLMRGLSPELWLPLQASSRIKVSGLVQAGDTTPGIELMDDRGRRWLWGVARLAPGASREQAGQELDAFAARLAETYPGTHTGIGVAALPAEDVILLPDFDGTIRAASWAVLGIVSLVLLIACANLANMLLARAVGRRKEMAARLALGASRRQLVRQLLMESLVLAALGGLAGLVLGRLAVAGFLALPLPLPIPIGLDLSLDLTVFLFAFGAALLSALAFGLAPALKATGGGLATTLREEGAAAIGGRRNRLAAALVVAQVALSLLLLIGAGLAVRSMQAARRIDPGFETEGVVAVSLSPRLAGYEKAQTEQFYRELGERLAALPGVESVGQADHLPLTLEINVEGTIPEEQATDNPNDWPRVEAASVSPGYFRTLGIPLLAGRDFAETDREDAPGVVVVNQTLARNFWPDGEAVGRRLRLSGPDRTVTVVGVVADGKYRTLGEDPRPHLWWAFGQSYESFREIVLRTSSPPAAILGEIRRVVRGLDEKMVISRLSTLEEAISGALLMPRLISGLLGVFGLLGLALSTVGLYGVVAYAVSLRTREMGIRMAMGASRAKVVRIVLRDGLRLAAVGVALGLAAALGVTRALAGVLYGVSATDPATFAAVALFLVAVAATASAIPAFRAARVDPVTALRHE